MRACMQTSLLLYALYGGTMRFAHLAAVEGKLAEGAGLVHGGGLLQRLEARLEHCCSILRQTCKHGLPSL